MPSVLTTLFLALLTLLSLVASIIAVVRLRRTEDTSGLRRAQFALAGLCAIGIVGLLLYRAVFVHPEWQKLLAAHVDGLLLLGSLFGIVVCFLQSRSRLPGLGAFAMPVLTLFLAWAMCSSRWTWAQSQFTVHSMWKAVHLASVYVGSLFFAVAAICGAMFLYVQSRLRHKRGLGPTGGLANLEAIERLIIRTSAIGFAVLTVALVTGLVNELMEPSKRLGPGWWHSPKVILAAAVWLIYALVMNVRHATAFRGKRAAWLSIIGLVLLLATFVATIALPLPPVDGGASTRPAASRAPGTSESP